MSIEESEKSGLSRRTMIKAAAWSAPVIAVAVATPLASASITNADTGLSVSNAGSVVVPSNTVGGAVNGSFSGSATVDNAGIGWNIDAVEISYELSGPITPTQLRFNGNPITTSTITSGAYTWAIVANENNFLSIELISPLPITVPADGTVPVPFPTITYTTTLTQTASTSRRVVATANATVYSGGNSIYDGNIKRFPA